MALTMSINGTPYKHFTQASVVSSITAVARGFSFTSTAAKDNSFPVKIGDRVTIAADGIFLVDGYIESLEINYDVDSHDIRVNGRSLLADFVDSTAPVQFEIKGTSLEAIAKSLIKAMGINAKIINNAGAIKGFKDDISSAEPGQNAHEFLESYTRKRQVLLTGDGADGLVLARAGTGNAPASLKNRIGARDNNILSASLVIDNSKRYYQYLVKAQLNTNIVEFFYGPADVSNQDGKAIDKEIRTGRNLTLNAEQSMDSFSAKNRAIWEKNLRIGAALNYNASIAGHTVNGKIWEPNTLVNVLDEMAQIDAQLLIKEVQFDYSVFSGSITRLAMVEKQAYTLEIEQSQREANSQKTAQKFKI